MGDCAVQAREDSTVTFGSLAVMPLAPAFASAPAVSSPASSFLGYRAEVRVAPPHSGDCTDRELRSFSGPGQFQPRFQDLQQPPPPPPSPNSAVQVQKYNSLRSTDSLFLLPSMGHPIPHCAF